MIISDDNEILQTEIDTDSVTLVDINNTLQEINLNIEKGYTLVCIMIAVFIVMIMFIKSFKE